MSRFVTVLVAAIVPVWVVAADIMPTERVRFVSPDRRYAVNLVTIDKERHFRITDIRTGQIDDSIAMPTLVNYLRWVPDSRSFITVEHIAGGSYGRVVYLKDDRWFSLEVTPPGDAMMDFTVTSIRMKENLVHFRLVMDYEKGNGIPFWYAFYDVDVGLSKGDTRNETWTPISRAEWLKSLKRAPSYP
jgi:hypothetical protein